MLRAAGVVTGLMTVVAPAGIARAAPTEIVAEAPPFALTVDELFAWRPTGPTADPRNVARTPVARRFVAPRLAGAASADPKVRVLFAPDGMNGLGNYVQPQRRFNLYGFAHWSQIDVLSWFAGTAKSTVNLPARPWVEAAHRNGVKVIGTVFFAPVTWGGSAPTVRQFLTRDAKGEFPAARQLLAIARHYGFDGWLINAETDVSAADARAMLAFMAQMVRDAPKGMEIHWYDALLPDGRVRWQNALTDANASFLQAGKRRTSDAMFLNYDWSRAGLAQSAALAERLGRSRYDLFIGADLWPMRDAPQAAFRSGDWLAALRASPGGQALGSIALFAPNFNYSFAGDKRTERFSRFGNDPGDADSFYATETRLFAGDRGNLLDPTKGKWPGIAALAAPRGLATTLPFRTSFNLGHGRVDMRNGERIAGPWHDMSRQDVLPTWQFAFPSQSGLKIGYDFDTAFDGGSSLAVVPAAPLADDIEVPLYAIDAAAPSRLMVSTHSRTEASGYALRVRFSSGRSRDFALPGDVHWAEQRHCINVAPGERVRTIALSLSRATSKPLKLGSFGLSAHGPNTSCEKD